MKNKDTAVHVVTTSRQYKGKTYQTHLLRHSQRQQGKVVKKTLANITCLGDEYVQLIKQALAGTQFVAVDSLFQTVESKPHGHIQAVLTTMNRLKLPYLLDRTPSRERNLVMAMIAARLLDPQSKLATTRNLNSTTLAQQLDVVGADENDLYQAMDWLISRQPSIQKRLAKRHLEENSQALLDLSSSYFEGSHCPLAEYGYSRDHRGDKPQINYGLLTDKNGCPIALRVFAGNVADPSVATKYIEQMQQDFGLKKFTLVGDRGMITSQHISFFQEHGIQWISALRKTSISKLVRKEDLQLELFDERNLFEFTSSEYPDERLVACRNPFVQEGKQHKRESLISKTQEALQELQKRCRCKKQETPQKLGMAVGQILGRYKTKKYFDIEFHEQDFCYQLNSQAIQEAQALDGVYVIRTNASAKQLSSEQAVRSYKGLSHVEQAFRGMKGVNILMRPIHHWTEDRVRAHAFICMLAYYVQWHMQQAWKELLFADEEPVVRPDPVDKAQRSPKALRKTQHGQRQETHSFSTLLASLATIVRNRNRVMVSSHQAKEKFFEQVTLANPQQQDALKRLEGITV